MNSLRATMAAAASGLDAQAARLRHVSENIANSDTPGYRRKTVEFRLDRESQTVSLGEVLLDRSSLKEVYDPAHPLADETGSYEGSNVNLIVELADAREAQRSYEANLKMFKQAREMSSRLLDLLRR
ncbi:MAG: flagellar basal body rod protein FlgC [Paracoccaceae bacterium]|jgi:flagellar basal-body rod protein FlgC|nr:flagellar basal body rod protein FlgC [Paracoccaceae bacterium]MDP7186284.1 flagellar basal body rod protein FlgC [Paracoccaceae bacterium]